MGSFSKESQGGQTCCCHLQPGRLEAELLSCHRPSGGAQALPNLPRRRLAENVTPVKNIHSTTFFFFKSGGGCDLSTQTELGVVVEGQLCR